MEKSRVSPFSLSFTVPSLLLLAVGCASQGKNYEALQFTDGVTEEPQIQRAIARFCDSAYIAVNQSEDVSSGEVLNRYQEVKSQRKKWTSGLEVAEMTRASLVSNRTPRQIVRILIEMEGRLPKNTSAKHVAELAKLAAIAEWETSVVASKFENFVDARKWTQSATPVEMTKVAIFTEKSTQFLLDLFDELRLRQGKSASERELMELTKVTALTGKTPNEIIKIFDQTDRATRGAFSRVRVAELMKISILTSSSPASVVARFNDFLSRKSLKLNSERALELTKISMLGKRTADDVVKTYHAMKAVKGMTETNEQMDSLTFSMLSGELLQDSVMGNNIDECNGAYARLFLSIDSYQSGES